MELKKIEKKNLFKFLLKIRLLFCVVSVKRHQFSFSFRIQTKEDVAQSQRYY